MTDSEINQAVARKLGYTKDFDFGWIVPQRHKDGFCVGQTTLPDYCRDIKAAWEIVDYLRARGVSVDLMVTPKLSRCTTREMAMGLIQTAAEAGPADAPRAICLAFLKLD